MGGKVRIAVLLSGGGTTLQNLIDRIADGTLPAQIAVVVSSRRDAYGLVRAQSAGIPAVTVSSRKHPDWPSHSKAVTEVLERYEPELLIMAGYMCLYHIPERWRGKVMNVHPGLIPAFCGKGFYGHHVHERVIEYGAKVSGCTVHFVDEHYDHGPIILQRVVGVSADDTPDTLAEKVMAEERKAFPEAIRLYAEGRLQVEDRRVRVLPGAWTPTSFCGL